MRAVLCAMVFAWAGSALAAEPVALPAMPTPAAMPTPIARARPMAKLTVADLRLDAEAQIRIDEGRVTVQMELQLHVERAGALVLDGFPVPLLAPIVRGSVLDRVVPPTSQALDSQAEGAVKVERRAGGLVAIGTLTAAQAGIVRVRYSVPAKEANLVLGWRPTAGRSWLTAAVVAVDPARVRLAFDRPARTSRFEQGRDRLTGASLAQPMRMESALKNGELLRVGLADLPTPARAVQRALIAIGTLFALLALAVVVRHGPAASTPAATTGDPLAAVLGKTGSGQPP